MFPPIKNTALPNYKAGKKEPDSDTLGTRLFIFCFHCPIKESPEGARPAIDEKSQIPGLKVLVLLNELLHLDCSAVLKSEIKSSNSVIALDGLVKELGDGAQFLLHLSRDRFLFFLFMEEIFRHVQRG